MYRAKLVITGEFMKKKSQLRYLTFFFATLSTNARSEESETRKSTAEMLKYFFPFHFF